MMSMSYQVASSTGGTMAMAGMNNNNSITINTSNMGHINSGMMSDDMSEPSSPDSASFDASDLLSSSVNDDVTAQLAAAGPIGVAAAAAIASSRKRKHPHNFETNPSKRKRQQTRLLRKLKTTIDEYTTRIGQQAIVLCCTPGKMSQSVHSFKVFGSQPLESVGIRSQDLLELRKVSDLSKFLSFMMPSPDGKLAETKMKNNKNLIMQELEHCLAEQAPPATVDNTGLHELPPLVIDGIPTPVDKMTQAQLRNFIPEMLKYSTGRSKPGWGKDEFKPLWWPIDLPWANVRSDARTEDEKNRVSWTEALRTIVKNCYKHHGREDLLHVFNEETANVTTQAQPVAQAHPFTGTMVQTINNPDGTVSLIQIDTSPQSIVTLPDGTHATVVHAIQHTGQQDGTQAVHTLAEVAASQQDAAHTLTAQMTPVSMAINSDATALATLPINHGGQIILASDAQIGGIVTIPVSMYHTMTGATVGMAAIADDSQPQTMQVAMAPLTATAAVSNISDLVNKTGDVTHAIEIVGQDPQQQQEHQS